MGPMGRATRGSLSARNFWRVGRMLRRTMYGWLGAARPRRCLGEGLTCNENANGKKSSRLAKKVCCRKHKSVGESLKKIGAKKKVAKNQDSSTT